MSGITPCYISKIKKYRICNNVCVFFFHSPLYFPILIYTPSFLPNQSHSTNATSNCRTPKVMSAPPCAKQPGCINICPCSSRITRSNTSIYVPPPPKSSLFDSNALIVMDLCAVSVWSGEPDDEPLYFTKCGSLSLSNRCCSILCCCICSRCCVCCCCCCCCIVGYSIYNSHNNRRKSTCVISTKPGIVLHAMPRHAALDVM